MKSQFAVAGAIALLMAAVGCTTAASSTARAAPTPTGAPNPVEVLDYLDIRTGTKF
jgi:hypothetical protein